MPRRLEHTDLEPLARGYSLLGSGGGGPTIMVELLLRDPAQWPIDIAGLDELDPATPCLGAAFVGATLLLGEKLVGADPFGPLIAAVERWLGHPVPAVCSLEGGGVNGLTPLLLAGERTVVDADGTGRAVPGLDQMSLFVDRVPGLVFASDTGAGGVALVQSDRALDVERVVRSAIIQAGGAGCAVLGGFTVGDLREHAIAGHLGRALELGRAFRDAATGPLPDLAAALGGRLLVEGRITAIAPLAADPHVTAVEVAGARGEVHRVVCRSETLAVVTDGEVQASAPAVLVALDAVSRDVLEVTDLTLARTIAVIELPASPWWAARDERLSRVAPSAYGLAGLDAAA